MAPVLSLDAFPGNSANTVMRELAIAYQTVVSFDAGALKRFDLTPPQADVIVSLGHRPGQSCRELSDSTLINRGSLSSILDRLESRRLITRALSRTDRRKTVIRLTARGSDLLDRLEPERSAHIASRLEQIDVGKQGMIVDSLRTLQRVFQ